MQPAILCIGRLQLSQMHTHWYIFRRRWLRRKLRLLRRHWQLSRKKCRSWYSLRLKRTPRRRRMSRSAVLLAQLTSGHWQAQVLGRRVNMCRSRSPVCKGRGRALQGPQAKEAPVKRPPGRPPGPKTLLKRQQVGFAAADSPSHSGIRFKPHARVTLQPPVQCNCHGWTAA